MAKPCRKIAVPLFKSGIIGVFTKHSSAVLACVYPAACLFISVLCGVCESAVNVGTNIGRSLIRHAGVKIVAVYLVDSHLKGALEIVGDIALVAYDLVDVICRLLNRQIAGIYGKLNVKNCIDSECKEKFTSSVNKAIESKDRAECVLSMHEINGKKHWFKTHLRFVSETGVSSVLIAYFTDVTDMVLTDKRINEYKNYIQDEIDRKHKILIVSNNSDTRCQLEEILSQENTVFTAETIQAGKKLLLNEDIDLIYFDIQLISKDDEFPLDIDERRLPVIAITQAHSVLKGMTKLKNRVSDFVMKPYIDELVRLRTNNLLKINISGSANEKYFSRTK